MSDAASPPAIRYEITCLFGTKKFDPVKYRLTSETVRRGWLGGERERFYIDSDFIRLGPFETRGEAVLLLRDLVGL